jgi:hypothetical protein
MTAMVMNYRNINKMRYFINNVSAFVRFFYKRIKKAVHCDKYNFSPSLCMGG